jgi:hypothetical protein
MRYTTAICFACLQVPEIASIFASFDAGDPDVDTMLSEQRIVLRTSSRSMSANAWQQGLPMFVNASAIPASLASRLDKGIWTDGDVAVGAANGGGSIVMSEFGHPEGCLCAWPFTNSRSNAPRYMNTNTVNPSAALKLPASSVSWPMPRLDAALPTVIQVDVWATVPSRAVNCTSTFANYSNAMTRVAGPLIKLKPLSDKLLYLDKSQVLWLLQSSQSVSTPAYARLTNMPNLGMLLLAENVTVTVTSYPTAATSILTGVPMNSSSIKVYTALQTASALAAPLVSVGQGASLSVLFPPEDMMPGYFHLFESQVSFKAKYVFDSTAFKSLSFDSPASSVPDSYRTQWAVLNAAAVTAGLGRAGLAYVGAAPSAGTAAVSPPTGAPIDTLFSAIVSGVQNDLDTEVNISADASKFSEPTGTSFLPSLIDRLTTHLLSSYPMLPPAVIVQLATSFNATGDALTLRTAVDRIFPVLSRLASSTCSTPSTQVDDGVLGQYPIDPLAAPLWAADMHITARALQAMTVTSNLTLASYLAAPVCVQLLNLVRTAGQVMVPNTTWPYPSSIRAGYSYEVIGILQNASATVAGIRSSLPLLTHVSETRLSAVVDGVPMQLLAVGPHSTNSTFNGSFVLSMPTDVDTGLPVFTTKNATILLLATDANGARALVDISFVVSTPSLRLTNFSELQSSQAVITSLMNTFYPLRAAYNPAQALTILSQTSGIASLMRLQTTSAATNGTGIFVTSQSAALRNSSVANSLSRERLCSVLLRVLTDASEHSTRLGYRGAGTNVLKSVIVTDAARTLLALSSDPFELTASAITTIVNVSSLLASSYLPNPNVTASIAASATSGGAAGMPTDAIVNVLSSLSFAFSAERIAVAQVLNVTMAITAFTPTAGSQQTVSLSFTRNNIPVSDMLYNVTRSTVLPQLAAAALKGVASQSGITSTRVFVPQSFLNASVVTTLCADAIVLVAARVSSNRSLSEPALALPLDANTVSSLPLHDDGTVALNLRFPGCNPTLTRGVHPAAASIASEVSVSVPRSWIATFAEQNAVLSNLRRSPEGGALGDVYADVMLTVHGLSPVNETSGWASASPSLPGTIVRMVNGSAVLYDVIRDAPVSTRLLQTSRTNDSTLALSLSQRNAPVVDTIVTDELIPARPLDTRVADLKFITGQGAFIDTAAPNQDGVNVTLAWRQTGGLAGLAAEMGTLNTDTAYSILCPLEAELTPALYAVGASVNQSNVLGSDRPNLTFQANYTLPVQLNGTRANAEVMNVSAVAFAYVQTFVEIPTSSKLAWAAYRQLHEQSSPPGAPVNHVGYTWVLADEHGTLSAASHSRARQLIDLGSVTNRTFTVIVNKTEAVYNIAVSCGSLTGQRIVKCGPGFRGRVVHFTCPTVVLAPACGTWMDLGVGTGTGQWNANGCTVVSASNSSITCACRDTTQLQIAARFAAFAENRPAVFAATPSYSASEDIAYFPHIFILVAVVVAGSIAGMVWALMLDHSGARRYLQVLKSDPEVKFVFSVLHKGRLIDELDDRSHLVPELSLTEQQSENCTADGRKDSDKHSVVGTKRQVSFRGDKVVPAASASQSLTFDPVDVRQSDATVNVASTTTRDGLRDKLFLVDPSVQCEMLAGADAKAVLQGDSPDVTVTEQSTWYEFTRDMYARAVYARAMAVYDSWSVTLDASNVAKAIAAIRYTDDVVNNSASLDEILKCNDSAKETSTDKVVDADTLSAPVSPAVVSVTPGSSNIQLLRSQSWRGSSAVSPFTPLRVRAISNPETSALTTTLPDNGLTSPGSSHKAHEPIRLPLLLPTESFRLFGLRIDELASRTGRYVLRPGRSTGSNTGAVASDLVSPDTGRVLIGATLLLRSPSVRRLIGDASVRALQSSANVFQRSQQVQRRAARMYPDHLLYRDRMDVAEAIAANSAIETAFATIQPDPFRASQSSSGNAGTDALVDSDIHSTTWAVGQHRQGRNICCMCWRLKGAVMHLLWLRVLFRHSVWGTFNLFNPKSPRLLRWLSLCTVVFANMLFTGFMYAYLYGKHGYRIPAATPEQLVWLALIVIAICSGIKMVLLTCLRDAGRSEFSTRFRTLSLELSRRRVVENLLAHVSPEALQTSVKQSGTLVGRLVREKLSVWEGIVRARQQQELEKVYLPNKGEHDDTDTAGRRSIRQTSVGDNDGHEADAMLDGLKHGAVAAPTRDAEHPIPLNSSDDSINSTSNIAEASPSVKTRQLRRPLVTKSHRDLLSGNTSSAALATARSFHTRTRREENVSVVAAVDNSATVNPLAGGPETLAIPNLGDTLSVPPPATTAQTATDRLQVSERANRRVVFEEKQFDQGENQNDAVISQPRLSNSANPGDSEPNDIEVEIESDEDTGDFTAAQSPTPRRFDGNHERHLLEGRASETDTFDFDWVNAPRKFQRWCRPVVTCLKRDTAHKMRFIGLRRQAEKVISVLQAAAATSRLNIDFYASIPVSLRDTDGLVSAFRVAFGRCSISATPYYSRVGGMSPTRRYCARMCHCNLVWTFETIVYVAVCVAIIAVSLYYTLVFALYQPTEITRSFTYAFLLALAFDLIGVELISAVGATLWNVVFYAHIVELVSWVPGCYSVDRSSMTNDTVVAKPANRALTARLEHLLNARAAALASGAPTEAVVVTLEDDVLRMAMASASSSVVEDLRLDEDRGPLHELRKLQEEHQATTGSPSSRHVNASLRVVDGGKINSRVIIFFFVTTLSA